MIYSHFQGQIGNQFFQHVLAKIAAEVTGQAYTPQGYWLNKQRKPVAWTQQPYVNQCGAAGIAKLSNGMYVNRTEFWLDLAALPKNRDICLRGFFQRYELLKPWKEIIKQGWLKVSAVLPATDPEAVYIHVRRTDYVTNDPGQPPLDTNRCCIATSLDEYAACLERFKPLKKLVLVTDDRHDLFLEEFKQFGVPTEVCCGAWDQDFLLLLAAKQLLISQSTFSWWAGLLGQADKIVCPMFPDTYWWRGRNLYGLPKPGEQDYPNLVVTDEPKWEFLS